MAGKLLLVGIIIAIIGVLAYSQHDKLGIGGNPAIDAATQKLDGIKNNPTVNAVTQNLDGLKDTTVKRVSYEIDKTGDAVGDKIQSAVPEVNKLNPISQIQDKLAIPQQKQVYNGEVYETDDTQKICQISVPKMAKTVNGQTELTHTISVQDCTIPKHSSAQVTVSTDPATGAQTISVQPTPTSQIFQTLKLTTTKNSDNTVSIHYEDSSGKTTKVTVTMRNSQKQIFSGEFFASKFDTSVGDVTNSPHITEMVVEHADYGTVSSSVYSPQGNDESTIYGVFTK